jgi:predicted ATPase
MLQSVTLKFTEAPTSVVVPAQGVTVFVGPNNSGKSLVLREIEQALATNGMYQGKIVHDFEIVWPDQQQFESDLHSLIQKAPIGTPADQVFIGRFTPAGGLDSAAVSRETLINQYNQHQKYWVASQFLRLYQIRLDGRTRFDLTSDRPSGDLLRRPENFLTHLFQDEEIRKEVRDIIFDAFESYLVIDPMNLGNMRIRLSPTEPTGDEQSLNAAAREFYSKATHIKDASDGVQAFTGIVTLVRSGDYRLILIDEPEAFLHPPLARKLGNQLTKIAIKNGGSLMASTHSPDFLMGCLQASQQVRVVRLEYSKDKSRGQTVDAGTLTNLFKAPLMRSANVISALFHEGVVVTESDNDRSFYAEVYHRIAEKEPVPSILFVNAQNKQTIRDILGPLRTFGVPAAAITDIDVLKDGGNTWLGWLRAIRMPEPLHPGLGQTRGTIMADITAQGININNGVDALPDPLRPAVNQLFDNLQEYGAFVTRKGQLEDWLKPLNVPGKKTEWTVAMLERMGSDPNDQNYVKPGQDDVWQFMRSIIDWVKNPTRRGTTGQ